jgi:hypothetical protein
LRESEAGHRIPDAAFEALISAIKTINFTSPG